ncbi:MAG: efflux RND transporter periplasmic adaptor subunit [Reyranella sp.]|uniref:efflux RND transporter periplasmic adaptor subunit n=1 Tax=Reyranella sp. TaxID=1929291 RepID=UPI001211919D|nr:efflux RND transporter periplasmic adaptor subunit [Reyranella sp.]TAJ94849.1 MAG: efflux RND transporter periplasmic adaptor subunit [Reyranella sp.]
MKTSVKIILAIVGAAVVLGGGAFAWKNGKGTTPAGNGPVAAKVADRPLELIPAELHTIKPRGLVDVVRFTGTTQPIDQTIVKSRVSGRLAEVLVREGDRVTEGQVLARFETTELQAKLNERQSALEAARADARWTARDRSDKETLANRNIVSQSAADQARATAENRASMVAVAEAQLDVARKNLADAEVRAPFDGVVGERIANQGESLPIDGKILALLDTSHVEIAAQMPAADVIRMKVGQTAQVNLEGFGDRVFDGRITRISPTTQPGSRSIPVYVEIVDRHEALRGGLFGTGTVTVHEKGHALAVPASAMRKDELGDYVLVVENGTLVRKPVGAVRTWSRGELVEVKGLESGMTVVSAPLPGLQAGQKVKLVETR